MIPSLEAAVRRPWMFHRLQQPVGIYGRILTHRTLLLRCPMALLLRALVPPKRRALPHAGEHLVPDGVVEEVRAALLGRARPRLSAVQSRCAYPPRRTTEPAHRAEGRREYDGGTGHGHEDGR